jgi:tetratricopeptide (TPR) repeat protein
LRKLLIGETELIQSVPENDDPTSGSENEEKMKRLIVLLVTLIVLVAAPARSEDAMKYYDLGVQSSVTRKKIEYFTKALELNPGLVQAYEKRGMLHYYQENYGKVIEDFLTYIELAPAKAEAFRMVGIGYLKKGYYEPALDYFTRAMEMEPEQIWAYANRAETYRLMGWDEEAMDDATRAIELRGDPRSKADAYRTRFKIHWKRGQDKLARADYRKSVELDPRITLWRYPNKRYPSPEEVSRVGLFGIIGIAFVLIFGGKLRPPDK